MRTHRLFAVAGAVIASRRGCAQRGPQWIALSDRSKVLQTSARRQGAPSIEQMPQEFSRLARLATTAGRMSRCWPPAVSGGGSVAADGQSSRQQSGGQSAPAVTLSSRDRDSSGQTVTLTWSVSNASSYTASGGWSGPRQRPAPQVTAALTATTELHLSRVPARAVRIQERANVRVIGAPAAERSPLPELPRSLQTTRRR